MGESLPGANDASKSEKEDDSAPDVVKSVQTSTVQPSQLSRDDRKKDRHYRKRHSSSSGGENSDNEQVEPVVVKQEKDVDADSDFTGSSSSGSESESSANGSGSEEGEIRKKNKASKLKKVDDSVPKKKQKMDTESKADKANVGASPSKEKTLSNVSVVKEEKLSDDEEKKPSEEKTTVDKIENIGDKSSDNVKVEVKPKINIWAKRTVGQAYDDAVQRYYERKALRTASRRA